MHLWAHSDALYLSEPKSRLRAGGYAFPSVKPNLLINSDNPLFPSNAPINVLSKLINAVMLSTQELKTGAGYINAKNLVLVQQALIEMGHPQGPTHI